MIAESLKVKIGAYFKYRDLKWYDGGTGASDSVLKMPSDRIESLEANQVTRVQSCQTKMCGYSCGNATFRWPCKEV